MWLDLGIHVGVDIQYMYIGTSVARPIGIVHTQRDLKELIFLWGAGDLRLEESQRYHIYIILYILHRKYLLTSLHTLIVIIHIIFIIYIIHTHTLFIHIQYMFTCI